MEILTFLFFSVNLKVREEFAALNAKIDQINSSISKPQQKIETSTERGIRYIL